MGFNHSITTKLYSFMGHVHVIRYNASQSQSTSFSEPIPFDGALAGEMQRMPHVRAVVPFAVRPVIVQSQGQMEGLLLKGVNSNYKFPEGITLNGNAVNYGDSAYSKQLLLSQNTADKLKVAAGDTVRIHFVDNGIPRIRKLKVAGTYHSGMDEVDKMYGLCDLRLIQRINNWAGDSINGYQLDLDNERFSDTVSNFIHYNLIDPPIESYTTKENYAFIFDWLDLQGINGVVLLVIMAIVSIINMGAVLLILIIDRAKMIGLLKALGMPFADTRNIFLAIAALIGVAGIVLGNVLGLGLCWLQDRFGLVPLPEESYYMKYVPVRVIWWHIVVLDVVTLVLCVLCMLLPALYVRKVHPAKVLQFK